MAHTFKPERATVDHVEDEHLPEMPGVPFRLMWHPESWEEKDGVWYPRIKWWRLQSGVNGVKSQAKGGAIQAQAIMEHARGFQVLDPTRTPIIARNEDGQLEESRGYVDKYPAAKGKYIGTVYMTPWDVPEVVGYGQRARVVWKFDAEAFDAWRTMLIAAGIVDLPRQSTLAAIIDVQKRRAERRISEAHDGAPHVQRHVEAQHARVEAMETAAAALVAPEPEPKKRRKTRDRDVSA